MRGVYEGRGAKGQGGSGSGRKVEGRREAEEGSLRKHFHQETNFSSCADNDSTSSPDTCTSSSSCSGFLATRVLPGAIGHSILRTSVKPRYIFGHFYGCLTQIYSLYKHDPLAGLCFVFVNHVLVTRQHESGDVYTLYAGSDPFSPY